MATPQKQLELLYSLLKKNLQAEEARLSAPTQTYSPLCPKETPLAVAYQRKLYALFVLEPARGLLSVSGRRWPELGSGRQLGAALR